jgi:hypothetical protein
VRLLTEENRELSDFATDAWLRLSDVVNGKATGGTAEGAGSDDELEGEETYRVRVCARHRAGFARTGSDAFACLRRQGPAPRPKRAAWAEEAAVAGGTGASSANRLGARSKSTSRMAPKTPTPTKRSPQPKSSGKSSAGRTKTPARPKGASLAPRRCHQLTGVNTRGSRRKPTANRRASQAAARGPGRADRARFRATWHVGRPHAPAWS